MSAFIHFITLSQLWNARLCCLLPETLFIYADVNCSSEMGEPKVHLKSQANTVGAENKSEANTASTKDMSSQMVSTRIPMPLFGFIPQFGLCFTPKFVLGWCNLGNVEEANDHQQWNHLHVAPGYCLERKGYWQVCCCHESTAKGIAGRKSLQKKEPGQMCCIAIIVSVLSTLHTSMPL